MCVRPSHDNITVRKAKSSCYDYIISKCFCIVLNCFVLKDCFCVIKLQSNFILSHYSMCHKLWRRDILVMEMLLLIFQPLDTTNMFLWYLWYVQLSNGLLHQPVDTDFTRLNYLCNDRLIKKHIMLACNKNVVLDLNVLRCSSHNPFFSPQFGAPLTTDIKCET